jgi:hypothetical protein
MAINRPSANSPLKTVPKYPSPILNELENLWVILEIWLKLKLTGPILVDCEERENLEGLGGTLREPPCEWPREDPLCELLTELELTTKINIK